MCHDFAGPRGCLHDGATPLLREADQVCYCHDGSAGVMSNLIILNCTPGFPLPLGWQKPEKDFLSITFDTVTDTRPRKRDPNFICCFIMVSTRSEREGHLSQIGYFLIGIHHSLGLVLTLDVVLTLRFPIYYALYKPVPCFYFMMFKHTCDTLWLPTLSKVSLSS